MNHCLAQNGIEPGLITFPALLEPCHYIRIKFACNGSFYRLEHLTLFPRAEFGEVSYFWDIGIVNVFIFNSICPIQIFFTDWGQGFKGIPNGCHNNTSSHAYSLSGLI